MCYSGWDKNENTACCLSQTVAHSALQNCPKICQKFSAKVFSVSAMICNHDDAMTTNNQWRPRKYKCEAPCLPTAGYTGVFPPALSSPVITNCPQVGVVKVT